MSQWVELRRGYGQASQYRSVIPAAGEAKAEGFELQGQFGLQYKFEDSLDDLD